jgi:hypothetical protein
MSDQDKQRWIDLCERAETERNPQKRSKIIQEANKLIDEKRSELRGKQAELSKA